ncbi:hypothetical protein SAMN04488500_105139 [Sporomusa malonica]|uniref:Uncharacterized protein n=2 Tax=Sporomusa malonica TaxID=112901 RepID=A0A1W2A7M3_9FIRM|nr:hypothetical protein SAMN04488500_105139 [Sporomusa malonica]
MELKLKNALQTTISDYYAIEQEIRNPDMTPARGLQLFAAKEALYQVLQHFTNAEYIEYINGRWRIKRVVMISNLSGTREQAKDEFDKAKCTNISWDSDEE